MKTTNFITLPDGRKLAYAEFGQPEGYPVIYFHGGGASSRLEPFWHQKTATHTRYLVLNQVLHDRHPNTPVIF